MSSILDVLCKHKQFQLKVGLVLVILIFSSTTFASGTSYNETDALPFATQLTEEQLKICRETDGMYLAPDGSCRPFLTEILWQRGIGSTGGEGNINFPEGQGNVGIGLPLNMPPQARLDIAGALRLRGVSEWYLDPGTPNDRVNKLYAIDSTLMWGNQPITMGESGGVTSESTGLTAVTENTKRGWRFIGKNDAKYGDIGNNAVDLSTSTVLSGIMGATGDNSVAMGLNTIASGTGSIAQGLYNRSEGMASFAGGLGTITAYTKVSGDASFSHQEVTALSGVKTVAARNSAILGGQNNAIEVGATKSVVLGGASQTATQPNMVYISGTKYKSYTAAQISALTNSELGTFLFDSTKGKLVQCTDASSGALVWKVLGGKFVDGTDAADAVFATGDVGIGIVNPTKALHVDGGARFDNTSGADAIEIGDARIYWDAGNSELVIKVNSALQ